MAAAAAQADDKHDTHSHHAKSGSKHKTAAEAAATAQAAAKSNTKARRHQRPSRPHVAILTLPPPQAVKTSVAAPEVQKLPEPIFWVKCDECDRWRIINGLTIEEQVKLTKKSWFCKMHPDPAQRECDKVVSAQARGGAAADGTRRPSEVGISGC